MHYLLNKLLSGKCWQLDWLGMDIPWGEEVFCRLHPQGQSDSAGQQHHWLFSAIVIYSSTQPEPAETHYPYCHVLFCSPLGSCKHTQTRISYTPLHVQNYIHKLACLEWTHTHAHCHVYLQLMYPNTLCAKKTTPLSVVSTGALIYVPIMDVGFFSHVLYFCPWFMLVVYQDEIVNSNDIS